jgi:predicted ATPase
LRDGPSSRQFDDAWRCIGEAITAVETNKEKWCDAEVHRLAGEIALKSPEPDAAKAQAYFERALTVARLQQAKSWKLRAAMSMARLWRDQGKPQQARELLAPVYDWFTEGFDTRDLKRRRRCSTSWRAAGGGSFNSSHSILPIPAANSFFALATERGLVANACGLDVPSDRA